MPIEDSGFYTRAGYGGVQFRDVIIWPPGWQPPAATETVTLGASVTVTSTGLLIAASVTSSGELWQAATSLPKSRRRGWVPGTSAGSYVAGNTLPIFRVPVFTVGHRPSRGVPVSYFGFAVFTNPYKYRKMYMTTILRQRTSNIAVVTLENPSRFIVGQQVTISGMSDASYNGTVTITSVSTSVITYASNGANESLTADTAGRCSVMSINFRIHQFSSAYADTTLTPFMAITGPQTINADAPDAPIASYNWSRKGISLKLISRLLKPYDPSVYANQYYSQLYQIWAPVAYDETPSWAPDATPDFCIDADIPGYQTMRIIWANGYPNASFPSVIGTPPYSGCTLTARRQAHTDRYSTSDGGNTSGVGIGIPEDSGVVRAISSLATPIMDADGRQYAIRPSLIPACIFSHFSVSSSPTPGTVNSCTGQWYRQRADGSVVALGSPVSVAYSYIFNSPNYDYTIRDTVSAPIDASRGDTPGYYFFRVVFDFTNPIGGNSVLTYDGSLNRFWLAASGEWNPLHPWPWDIPYLSFAADEAAVRYIGNPGWLMTTPTPGSVTLTPPTLSRSVNTITSTAGTATAATPTENVVGPKSLLIRTIAKAVAAGAENGGSGSSVAVTNAAFSGQPVDAEGTDCWQFSSSGRGQTCSILDIYTIKANAVLP